MVVLKLRVIMALGLISVLRVLWFRLSVRFGFNSVKWLQADVPEGPFFTAGVIPPGLAKGYQYAPSGFGCVPVNGDRTPPDWHRSILTRRRCVNPDYPWYLIPDFDHDLGDIKGVWELSRWDWVLGFAREYCEGKAEGLTKLEIWLDDWVTANPPYFGPNWKCGQEASIRVMHLAMAAIMLGNVNKPEASLLKLVEVHMQRIAPTINYAIAQDNNHGTSEAAALFIGGAWLAIHGIVEGERWQRQGRKWLENRARRLIEEDGSFSQYSVNYHRVVLDTFSMVEVWRRSQALPAFTEHWYVKTAVATEWLRAMLQPAGDAPNLGANDGARLLPLAATDYRDYRPSVQLASALFCQQRAIQGHGEWNVPLGLLGVEVPKTQAPAIGSALFDHGGYAILRNRVCFALLRYPRFRFRPGQADALHLDLWLGECNLLRDGGSFGYNTKEPWQRYFPGVESHNTVQFDDRDQMPRLSRFLFGEWLKTTLFEPLKETADGPTVSAGYCDYKGACHTRKVTLGKDRLSVEDEVSGFSKSAVLRWRLMPGEWKLKGQTATMGDVSIAVIASVPIVRCKLVEGWESRYYGQKTPLPVLEVGLAKPGHLTTEITWGTL
ncbi:alginate lyase family protein [Marinobacter sp. SS8-8]|uniref:heparinase II/III family protein n=1 Tax=Marinobacter sp. SS8-8 TaxID=3050452 RepID=UPI0026E003F1|nr:alginate lyase family protein [Marinobacter sp. SS8-8]